MSLQVAKNLNEPKRKRVKMAGEGDNPVDDELLWMEENDELDIDENFIFNNQVCWYCEGYYGPCFDEYVCRTCHAFLFPEILNVQKEAPLSSEKTDDEDSGNDEPNDLPPGAEGLNSPDLAFANGKTDSAQLPVVVPSQIDRLAEQLSLLTVPKDMSDAVDINAIPYEVMLYVFKELDDLSLWAVSRVCERWNLVVMKLISNRQWQQFTALRWPLFKPLYSVDDWAAVYSDLVESSTCFHCLYSATLKRDVLIPVNPWRTHRLCNEWKGFQNDPQEGIRASPLNGSCDQWQASITGPANSPYEGGIFYLHIQIPCTYPIKPPSVRFITKVFHPNISRHGNIGLDCIQENWSLALTISKILISVQSLLTDPHCTASMEPEVARLYLNDRQKYDAIARWWTWKFAMTDAPRPHRNHCSVPNL